MTRLRAKRLWAWWRLAEQVCGALTAPKVDVAAADRDVEAIVAASWLASRTASFASRFRAAWLDSTCRACFRSLTSRGR
jgi:hypothetical protein